ncbi:MAG TPA: hypothetical protein VM187_07150, partial [Niastella sp.]|nr:hypothetical protein [Niastella sp.]
MKSFGLFAKTLDAPIFRDDFNRNTLGSSWIADASWSIVNGAAYTAVDGIDEKLKTATAYNEPSYIIETAVKGFTNNYFRVFRITFGQADLTNDALYQVKYTAYGGGRLTLSKSVGKIYDPVILDEVPLFPEFISSQWYAFKIARYKSGLIQVYIDNGSGYGAVPILEGIDMAYSTMGHIGWHVGTESFAEEFRVDYISAVRPDLEKPAVREKPAEDDLIKQVTVKSGKTYTVRKLNIGVKQLIDRSYTITSLPAFLRGASFIQTANDDKLNTSDNFMSFFVTTDVIVYIGYDPRAKTIPEWLTKWTKTGYKIGVSDANVDSLDVYHRVIRNEERYYPVILGGNLASPAIGAKTNYLVAAVESPGYQYLQAEDAFLSGAVVASNHANYFGTGF